MPSVISENSKWFATEEKQLIDLLSSIIVINLFKAIADEGRMHCELEEQ